MIGMANGSLPRLKNLPKYPLAISSSSTYWPGSKALEEWDLKLVRAAWEDVVA